MSITLAVDKDRIEYGDGGDFTFNKFYYTDFSSSRFVADLVLNRTKSIQEYLLELYKYVNKLDIQIASHMSLHQRNLTSRIYNLDKMRMTLTLLKRRLSRLKAEVCISASCLLRRHFYLQGYSSLFDRMRYTSNGLNGVLRCLAGFDMLRKSLRSMRLAGKHSHMGPRNIVRATKALHVSERILAKTDVKAAYILTKERVFLGNARDTVCRECSYVMSRAVQTLNQNDLGYTFLALFNLQLLPVEAFKILSLLAREVSDSFKKMEEVPSKPSPKELPGARTRLWKIVDGLTEKIYTVSVQAWNIERVLKNKRDPLSRQTLLQHVCESKSFVELVESSGYRHGLSNTTDNFIYGPFRIFWHLITSKLTNIFSQIAQKNNFVRKILSQEYPRLRLALHETLKRILWATHTRPNEVVSDSFGHQQVQREMLIQTISFYLKVFLARSHSRLLSMVPKDMPTPRDVEVFVSIALREEESVKHDGDLCKAILTGIQKASSEFCGRAIRHAVLSCGKGLNAKSKLLNIDHTVFMLQTIIKAFGSIIMKREDYFGVLDTIQLLSCTQLNLNNQFYSIPKSVLLHYIICFCPMEMEFPHVREQISLSEYVIAWTKNGEIEARKSVVKSLDLYRQRSSAMDTGACNVEHDSIRMLEMIIPGGNSRFLK